MQPAKHSGSINKTLSAKTSSFLSAFAEETKVRLFSFVHPINAPLPIYEISLGSLTSTRFEHPAKAYLSILIKLLPDVNTTSLRLSHSINAIDSMHVTVSEITIFFTSMHPAKAPSQILCIPAGTVKTSPIFFPAY